VHFSLVGGGNNFPPTGYGLVGGGHGPPGPHLYPPLQRIIPMAVSIELYCTLHADSLPGIVAWQPQEIITQPGGVHDHINVPRRCRGTRAVPAAADLPDRLTVPVAVSMSGADGCAANSPV